MAFYIMRHRVLQLEDVVPTRSGLAKNGKQKYQWSDPAQILSRRLDGGKLNFPSERYLTCKILFFNVVIHRRLKN